MAEVRRALRLIVAISLALVALARSPRSAEAQAPKATAAAVEKEKAAEEEAADSPRASMRAFVDFCTRSRWDDAARYLDVPAGNGKKGPELARKLYIVLSERVGLNPEVLSASSHGRPSDGLPPGTEELGKIELSKGHVVAIRLVRHEPRSPEDEPRWVFSQSTVQAIEPLYASLRGRWIRDRMPAPLVAQGPFALYWWQWVALPLLASLCLAVGRVLTWVTGMVAAKLTKKWRWSARILPRLKRPVTMAYGVACFALAMPYLGLTVRADELIERLLRALAYLAFFWGLLRSVTVAGDEMMQAEWARAKPGVKSLTSVGVRLGKVVVAALASMVALSELGYPVTSVIAGLGIGGVALALAAQKTVENLFGSISILADQPFVVGDTIKVDTVEGTVESIGLRSTRMRTADRTLIIIPNGKLADMRIESLGARERIRFATKLVVARDAKVEQLRAIVAGVRERLEEHEKVRKEDVFVRFTGLGEQSYDVEVSAMVETLDFNDFARIREDLLCMCIEEVEKSGARLSVPTRRLVDERAGGVLETTPAARPGA